METGCHSSPLNVTSSKPSSAAADDPSTVFGASPIGADISDAGNTNTTSTAGAAGGGGSSSSSATSGRLSSLKSLNKASYKISKPLSRNPNPVQRAPPPQPPAPTVTAVAGGVGASPQPPVYNIDKNDFRDVVQKLTGAPAHHQVRPAAPPPSVPPSAELAAPPAPATSRLHRIRPPPLAHLVPRRSPIVPVAVPTSATMAPADPWTRPPLSPLPPLPAVSAAAESPISAYMRRLHAGMAPSPTAAAAPGLPSLSSPLGFGCLPTPRTAYQMMIAPGLPSLSSPLGFGCLPSPRTAYQMMIAPGLVFPTSPGVPSPPVGEP